MEIESEPEAVDHLLARRIIGEYTQNRKGPLMVCMAGIHGNEPAGLLALKRAFEILEKINPPFKGTVVGLAGNMAALKEKKRFIGKDLNRCWTKANIDYLRKASREELKDKEDIEQKEVINLLDEYFERAHDDFLFVDLHTTSAKGGVFSICSDEKVTKSIAVNLQVPVIIGLEEVLHGTTLNYFGHRNLSAIGFEAGEHRDPDSVQNMVAAIFILLETLGCVREDDIPGFPLFEIRLGKIAHQLPDILEFRYRYDVKDNSKFQMLPGFKNFQYVERDTLVAQDNGKEIKTEESGLLLMPLYQKQGDDGFFLVKPRSVDDL